MKPLDFREWSALVDAYDLPFDDEDVMSMYMAAKPDTVECMALLVDYYRKGLYDEDKHNPFRIATTGSFHGLVSYPSWSDAIFAWATDVRVWDPTLSPSSRLIDEVLKTLDAIAQSEALPVHLPRPQELVAWWGSQTLFDPLDPVCDLWFTYGLSSGLYPQLSAITGTDERTIYMFTNGLRIVQSEEGVAFMRYATESDS